jgi:hypothetical protein
VSGPKRSGPWRPGALPACPPRSRLLGCGPWARPQVLGPRPGIAWGRLFHVSTPTRAVSRRTAVRCAPSESVPRGTRAVSAPRAVGCVLLALGRLPTEPSRATSVPASGPRAPAERVSACPGRPPDPQRRGPSPPAQRSNLHHSTKSVRVPPSVPGPGALGLCQRARPGVACPGAARGPRPQVLGPRPGIAWGRLFHVSTPTRAVSGARRSGARHPSQCPEAHRPSAPSQYPMAVTARRLDSRHPSQYPEAHGPSVPRARLDASWWRGTACLPSQAERPAFQPASPGSPAERISACPGRPPGPQRRGPSPRAQPSILHRATASARVPIPTQARASATGGCGTGQHVGLGADRRSGGDQSFIPQPPGCRQGTSLAPMAWHNCPAAKRCGPSGLRTFGSTTRPRGRGGASARRRGDKRACVHALTRRARISHGTHGTITARTDRSRLARHGHGAHASARRARHDHGVHGSVTARTPRSQRARLGHGAHAPVTARTLRSRRARFGHGAHGSVTARTPRSRRARIGHGVHVSIAVRAARHGRHCGHSGPGGLGDATITARAAERVAKRRQAGAAEGRSSVAGGAARGDGDFGRASGRFTSGRYQHSEGLRPGPRARRLSEGRPATAVTAGTAADHGGHGADHDFRGADHSDPCDVERAAGPESAAAAAAAAAAITIPSEGLEVEQPITLSPMAVAPPPACGAGGER